MAKKKRAAKKTQQNRVSTLPAKQESIPQHKSVLGKIAFWVGIPSVLAAATLFTHQHYSTSLQDPSAGRAAQVFRREINEQEYRRIYQQISELGISIDTKHSSYVSGSTRLVIHIPDNHDDKDIQNKQIASLDALIEHIGAGAVGIENEVGVITEQRAAEMWKKHKEVLSLAYEQIIPRAEAQRDTYLPKLLSATTHPALQEQMKILADYLTNGIINVEVAPLENITLAPYLHAAAGRLPLFGLEVDAARFQLAQDLHTAATINEWGLYAQPYWRQVESLKVSGASQQPAFMEAYTFFRGWEERIWKTYQAYKRSLQERGFTSFDQASYDRVMVDDRSDLWATASGKRRESIVITVGGMNHTSGYVHALKTKQNVSVITLSVE